MFKLRKGDGPKAAVLCLLIGIAGWFIYRTLSQLDPGTATAPPASRAAQRGSPSLAGKGEATSGQVMFAQRPELKSGLARIASTPDPFRPWASATPGAAPAAKAVASPVTVPTRPPLPPPLGAPALAGLRVTGIVSGRAPVAVLVIEGRRRIVRQGDMVGDGWQVNAIRADRVVLAKGGKRLELRLTREERPPRPMAMPPLR